MESEQNLRTRLLADVERVVPVLTEHAAASAELRRLDDASMAALRGTRLLSFENPRELGGDEADPLTQLHVLEALARVDASAAWCVGVLAGASAIVGAFLPRAAADRVYADGAPLIAGMAAPKGRTESRAGGYRVDGRWAFGSGIHHADWVIAGISPPGEPPPIRLAVLPREQVVIHDNWHVAGLEASGSCDYTIEDAFVPEDMTFLHSDLMTGNAVTGGAAVRLGIPAFVLAFHMAIPLGIARRALDEILEQAVKKTRGIPPSPLPMDAEFQLGLGRAQLEHESARTLAVDVLSGLWETAQGGVVPTVRQQTEARAAAAYVTEVAQRVTSAAFQAGGGAALFDTNPLQKCLRDIYAAGQHFMVSRTAYSALGQSILGQPDVNPMQ